MHRNLKHLFVLIAAAALVGCGGGGGEPAPVLVAPTDVTIAAAPATVSAVEDVPFTFPAGVPELGTTGTTTLAFTSTGTTPEFSITSEGGTATGTTQFGSCVFVVASSSFPTGHRLARGQTVTGNPCNIRLGTQGAPADSIARQRAAVFVLGSAASTGATVTVAINPGGTVTINGQAAGTVTLVPVSG